MKYACRQCPTPCFFTTKQTMAPNNRCLYFAKHAHWLTVEPPPQDSSTSHVVTKEPLRADGEPFVPQDVIMEAARDYSYHRYVTGNPTEKRFMALARAIEARDNALEEKIAEVDQRRYTDSKRISDHYQELDTLKTEIEAVRKLIEDCVKHDSAWMEQITKWRKDVDRQLRNDHACFRRDQASSLDYGIKDLQRKVEELENKVSQVLPDLTPSQHESPTVACADEGSAPDKETKARKLADLIRSEGQPTANDGHGKPHPLIPGVSVIQGRAIATAVFCKDKGEGLLRVRWLNTGLYGAFFLSQTTWLFDLNFPKGGTQ